MFKNGYPKKLAESGGRLTTKLFSKAAWIHRGPWADQHPCYEGPRTLLHYVKLLCKGRRHGVVTTQGGRRWYIQPSMGNQKACQTWSFLFWACCLSTPALWLPTASQHMRKAEQWAPGTSCVRFESWCWGQTFDVLQERQRKQNYRFFAKAKAKHNPKK